MRLTLPASLIRRRRLNAGARRRPSNGETQRVVFSGHSLTDAMWGNGGWPPTFPAICDSVFGVEFDHHGKSTIPGASLAWRWEYESDGDTDERRDIADFDVLLITEAGPGVLSNTPDGLEDTVSNLMLFANLALDDGAGGAGAEVLLHSINSWENGVASWGVDFPTAMVEYEKAFRYISEETAARLRATRSDLPSDYRIWIVPAHRMWAQLYDDFHNGPGVPGFSAWTDLFDETDPSPRIHPVPHISYGLACLTFVCLYHMDPAAIPGFYVPEGMSNERRDYLWALAHRVASEYRWAGMGGHDDGAKFFIEPPGDPSTFALGLDSYGYVGPTLTGLLPPVINHRMSFVETTNRVRAALSASGARYMIAALRVPTPPGGWNEPPFAFHSNPTTWWDGDSFAMRLNGFLGNWLADSDGTSTLVGPVTSEWAVVEMWCDGDTIYGSRNGGSVSSAAAVVDSTGHFSIFPAGGEPNIEIAFLGVAAGAPSSATRAGNRLLANEAIARANGPTLSFITNGFSINSPTHAVTGVQAGDLIVGGSFRSFTSPADLATGVGWSEIGNWAGSANRAARAFWKYAEDTEPDFGTHTNATHVWWHAYRHSHPPANPIGAVEHLLSGQAFLAPWIGLDLQREDSHVSTAMHRNGNESLTLRPDMIDGGGTGLSSRYRSAYSAGQKVTYPTFDASQTVSGSTHSLAIEILRS